MAYSSENYEYDLATDRARYQQAAQEDQHRQQLAVEMNTEDMEQAETQARMGWLFFLCLLIFSLILDIIEFFTAGTIGWIIGLFGDLILALVAGMSKSGRKQFKKILIALVGESIPIVATLPLRSIMVIWSFASSRSKKLQQVSAAGSPLGQVNK